MILLFMDFLPLIIGNIFFPHYELIAQALAVWGVFWFGFIVRPLGELVFGYLGDKIGRKFAITLSIYVMAIPTTLMGLTPSFEQIGLFALIILIVLRLLQGFVATPQLIQSTGLLTAPAFMLMAASLLSFIGTFFLKTK